MEEDTKLEVEKLKVIALSLKGMLDKVEWRLDEIDPPTLISEEEFRDYFREWRLMGEVHYLMVDMRLRRHITSWRAQHLPIYYLCPDGTLHVAYANLYNPKYREWSNIRALFSNLNSTIQYESGRVITRSSSLRMMYVTTDRWRSYYDAILSDLGATEKFSH